MVAQWRQEIVDIIIILFLIFKIFLSLSLIPSPFFIIDNVYFLIYYHYLKNIIKNNISHREIL
jgi:hypothetical protein